MRNIVEILFLDDFEPRAFALQFLKGFVRLIVRRVAVAKVPFPVFIFLPRRSLARGVARAMGVAKRKVGGVVGHGVALRGDVEVNDLYSARRDYLTIQEYTPATFKANGDSVTIQLVANSSRAGESPD